MRKVTLEKHDRSGGKVLFIGGIQAEVVSWMLLSKGETIPFPAVEPGDMANDVNLAMLTMCIAQLHNVDDDERLAASVIFLPMLEQARRTTANANP